MPKIKSVNPLPQVANFDDAKFKRVERERAERRFSDNYEFKKAPRARLVTSNWEYQAVREGDSYYDHSMSPRERALIEGKPHGFKGTKMDGKLRKSPKGGHRIGKR